MENSRLHVISAEDILGGGPVTSVISSRTGLSGSKSLSVVTDLETGEVACRVSIDGTDTDFARVELAQAVAFYNRH